MKKILNIILGILLAIMAVLGIYAIATGGSDASISANLIWCYILLVLAIVSAIFCAVFGMVQSPSGIKGTLLSSALIVVVVAIAYFVAASHHIEIPDFASGGVFARTPTVIADCGILVTYVAMIAAVVVALYSEVVKLFK
ncbi:hypothetical protein [uncultured Alistipes sp.]|uniref:hypothetical protein n=1 Tax=uncultured Alistipes sp. TaxID=538949 RepID=UPI002625ED09|nr:hypothetical protein [uncultured Alistipes sp.]